jgi:hypothetical protein
MSLAHAVLNRTLIKASGIVKRMIKYLDLIWQNANLSGLQVIEDLSH